MKRGNGIEQLFPTKKLRAQFEGITSTLDRFQRKALKYPSASEDGYIFRGELNYKTPLQSSLERKLWKRNEWKDSAFIPRHQIAAAEKRIVEDFVHEAKAGVATLVTNHNSNQWPPPGERDVFWWLALMQHYDQPTRLIDFSLDVYVALFFALEHYFKLRGFDPLTSSEPNLAIYCFPCRDTKTENPADTNKTPIAPSSSGIDMSRALGALMKLDCMADCKFEEERLSDQKFAWDRPHCLGSPTLRESTPPQATGYVRLSFSVSERIQKGLGQLVR